MTVVGKMVRMLCANCGHSDRHYLTSEEMSWLFICPECRCGMYEKARQSFGMRGYAFDPFVTDQITGEPLNITSPGQRDRVLAENGLTMDRISLEDQVRNRRRLLANSRLNITMETLRDEHERMQREAV